MSEASIAYGLDDVYYMDKFTEEDYPYEHFLNNNLYEETYFREEELREFSHYSNGHGHGKYYESPAPKPASVEHYLRTNPAAFEEESIPRGRPIYPVGEPDMEHPQHHMPEPQQHYRHQPARQMRYEQRPYHHQYPPHVQHHMPRKPQMPQHYGAGYDRPMAPQRNVPMPQAHKKFRKKTNKHAGDNKGQTQTRKNHKAQNGHYYKQNGPYTSRIRIHGDSWTEGSEGGFVGLVGKGGHKIGIYRNDKIDPLLAINNHHIDEKDKPTTINSSNFNTYHASAFWRLFGVEINNVADFRQTVGDRIVGFAVRPDGDVVVKTITFTANAAVNIVKVLDVLEDMRANGFRSRSVEELTTEGTIQAIVEQWMDGNKVIEMSL